MTKISLQGARDEIKCQGRVERRRTEEKNKEP
jgi:hypothetical protein